MSRSVVVSCTRYRISAYPACFPPTVHKTASPSLPRVLWVSSPGSSGTMGRCDFLTVFSPHLVSFAWRYLGAPAFRPRSVPDAQADGSSRSLRTGCSGPVAFKEPSGSPKFPGDPDDHSPCSSTPARPGSSSGPRSSLPDTAPAPDNDEGSPREEFRGSIAQRLIWLSTLRSGSYPPPRKTRFRLLVRLCRAGLVYPQGPDERFHMTILLSRASWRNVS
jgi:hypothetical protein